MDEEYRMPIEEMSLPAVEGPLGAIQIIILSIRPHNLHMFP